MENCVGVVIVTHGSLGQEFVRAAEMVLGEQEFFTAVGIDVQRGMDETLETVRSTIKSVDNGAGSLVLTDLFGGSPTTTSLSLLKSEPIEVVTGVNLPMVISALQYRTLSLDELATKVQTMGQNGIKVAGAMLRKKGKRG